MPVRSAAVCRISHSLSAAKSEYVKPCTASFSIMRFRYLNRAQYDLIYVKSAIKPQPGIYVTIHFDVLCSLRLSLIIIIIIIINDNVCGAVLMTMVTARVHPVHLMNAD